jgi:aminotransferase EvaB
MALGVGAGDEVITVANTCIPTIAAVRSVGAVPIFVDVRPDDLMMDVSQIEAAITGKTKCLLPVHLWGQGVHMARLMQIARRRKLAVVEDCAQAHQTKIDGQPAGTFGDVGCYSFYPTKNIGAYGDAGAVVTNDDALAGCLMRLRSYGLDGSAAVTRYGINARISEIQAAILRVKLRVSAPWHQARQNIARIYDQGICQEHIATPAPQPGVEHAYHQYVIRCENREVIIEQLRKQNISYGIHYPVPMHRMPAYEALVPHVPKLPVTEHAAAEILSLPIHEALTRADAQRVAETLVNRVSLRRLAA